MSEEAGAPTTAQPTLRLVRGDAEPEELAALLAVLSAHAGEAGPPAATPPRHGRWSDPALGLRRPLPAGPGAWRASGLPR